MTTNPKSFAYDAQSHRLICEICIEWIDFGDLYVDAYGVKWDICSACGQCNSLGGTDKMLERRYGYEDQF